MYVVVVHTISVYNIFDAWQISTSTSKRPLKHACSNWDQMPFLQVQLPHNTCSWKKQKMENRGTAAFFSIKRRRQIGIIRQYGKSLISPWNIPWGQNEVTRSQIQEVVVPIMYSRPELLVTQREIRSCEAKRDWAKNIRMKNAGCYNHGANSRSDRYYGIVPIAY